MVLVSQVPVSLIQATMSSIVISLLYEEIMSSHTFDLESYGNDYLPSVSFVDEK